MRLQQHKSTATSLYLRRSKQRAHYQRFILVIWSCYQQHTSHNTQTEAQQLQYLRRSCAVPTLFTFISLNRKRSNFIICAGHAIINTVTLAKRLYSNTCTHLYGACIIKGMPRVKGEINNQERFSTCHNTTTFNSQSLHKSVHTLRMFKPECQCLSSTAQKKK